MPPPHAGRSLPALTQKPSPILKPSQNDDYVVQKSISQVSETKTKDHRPKIEGEEPKSKAQRQRLNGARLTKIIQNGDDVVQKSMSQVSEPKTEGRGIKIEE